MNVGIHSRVWEWRDSLERTVSRTGSFALGHRNDTARLTIRLLPLLLCGCRICCDGAQRASYLVSCGGPGGVFNVDSGSIRLPRSSAAETRGYDKSRIAWEVRIKPEACHGLISGLVMNISDADCEETPWVI